MNQDDHSKGLTTCNHTIACPNCREEHFADDSSCKMRNHAACEECQRRKVGRGQLFISNMLGPAGTIHDPGDFYLTTSNKAPPMTFNQQAAQEQQMFGQGQTSSS